MPDSPLQHDSLVRAQLRSEQKRAVIILAMFGLLGVVGSVAMAVGGNVLAEVTGSPNTVWIIGTALATFLTFQGSLALYFRRCAATARVPPRGVLVGATVLEALAPTGLIYLLSGFIPGGQAVDAPPLVLYYLIIILSTLRLDPKLSILTGILCGLGYLAVGLLSMEAAAQVGSHRLGAYAVPHVARAVTMVVGGAIAAFVTREILAREQLARRLREERQRVVDVFGQHVSPAVVDKVLAQDAELHSEMRHVCVMFLDIRDFTAFSESRPPDQVVDFLNRLFEPLVDVIGRHHGVINKFLGDGFMAVFGAPLSDGRDCENALRASLEALQVVDRLRAEGAIAEVDVGIGLHAGQATTGTVGSRQRKEYTVIGDTVNLASRIEGLNKRFDSRLLVSRAVWDAVSERFAALPAEDMAPVQVKGRAEPVTVVRLARTSIGAIGRLQAGPGGFRGEMNPEYRAPDVSLNTLERALGL